MDVVVFWAGLLRMYRSLGKSGIFKLKYGVLCYQKIKCYLFALKGIEFQVGKIAKLRADKKYSI